MTSAPGHAHAHSHSHAHGAHATRRRLGIALVLVASYMVAEVVGGLLTGSLALLADAGHMLSDTAALALALFASWVAQGQRSIELAVTGFTPDQSPEFHEEPPRRNAEPRGFCEAL